MAQIILEGMTVDTLSDIIRETVKDEISKGTASPPPTPEDTYLTRKEAANRLRVSLVTLTEWVNRSKIKAYKIGGRVLFRENDVEEALARIVPLKYRRR